MAEIAKRYAAIICECYDNVGFYLEDLAYHTGEEVVHDRDDEDLPGKLVEEIENIGCIDLADEITFLVYDENYEQVEFTKEQLEEILKPLSWIKVIDENESLRSFNTSKMGKFNTNTESTMAKYIKDNSKAKVVLEDFSKFSDEQASNIKDDIEDEIKNFSNKIKHFYSLGMLITEKANIDKFLSGLSPENILFVSQESKTSMQLFAFENEKQFEEFKANSVAYKNYQAYLKDPKGEKTGENLAQKSKEYKKPNNESDMNSKCKNNSLLKAHEIVNDLLKKLKNKEIILSADDILKVSLPEDKIVCLYADKQGVQMLGFQNEEHFKDFSSHTLSEKNIIEYNPNESEDEPENE